MAQRNNTELQAHLHALGHLLDAVAHQEGHDTLGLVVLDHIDDISSILGLTQNHGNTGDIAGNQRHTQGANDGIGHEADAGLIGVGLGLQILQALDNFSAHSGGKTGIQSLAQVFLIGDEALEHAHAGRQIAQSLDLHAGSGVDGGEIIGGIGEGDLLVSAILGDGIVDGALHEAGDGITAAIDQISQYTHDVFPPNKLVLFYQNERENLGIQFRG